jgi:hypothetical protein
VKRAFWLLALLAIGLCAFVVRCWNLPDVFIGYRIYFIDPDCYSRMTRAARVAEGSALIIRQHDFENWPDGIRTHTTAPLDWIIVAGKWIADCGLRIADPDKTSVLQTQSLDLSGALISPLLGALTCAWLAAWGWSSARHSSLVARHLFFAAPLLFIISPIAVHGTVLGRPDHQSLMIFLLAIAIGAEVRLMQTVREWESAAQLPSRHIAQWSLIAGASGGLAMWVSLYEPLVLFGVVVVLVLLLDREQFRWRERWWGWALALAIFAVSLLIDGWRFTLPGKVARDYFINWSRSIGELGHLSVAGVWPWFGWAAALAPVTLAVVVWMKARQPFAPGKTGAHPAYRPAAFLLGLLLVTFGLTCWQLRWGYFCVLVFSMSLPWQLAALRRWWIAWPAFLISLYPIADDWDVNLFPDGEHRADERTGRADRRAMRRTENVALREIVAPLRDTPGGFIAPWWQSPAIAYWTRSFGVAGSSHESLPGIVETARFYLAEQFDDAAQILKKRRVSWVLADETTRTVGTSAALLGVEAPSNPIAEVLAEHPQDAPPFLRAWTGSTELAPGTVFYRLYQVDAAKLPP